MAVSKQGADAPKTDRLYSNRYRLATMAGFLVLILLPFVFSCDNTPPDTSYPCEYDRYFLMPYDSATAADSFLRLRENNARWEMYKSMKDLTLYDHDSNTVDTASVLSCWLKGTRVETHRDSIFGSTLRITLLPYCDCRKDKVFYQTNDDALKLYYNALFIYDDPQPFILHNLFRRYAQCYDVNYEHYQSSRVSYPDSVQLYIDTCVYKLDEWAAYKKQEELAFIAYLDKQKNIHPWLKKEAAKRKKALGIE